MGRGSSIDTYSHPFDSHTQLPCGLDGSTMILAWAFFDRHSFFVCMSSKYSAGTAKQLGCAGPH